MGQEKSTKAIKPIRAQRRVSECSGRCTPAIKGKLSAFTVIRVSALVRRLAVALLTFAGRRSRITGLPDGECVLSPRFRLSTRLRANGFRRVSRYLSPQSCSQRLFKCGVRGHRDD